MALRDQPYLPLYIQDFMTDEKLAECSACTTGVYIRLMCLMHKSDEYGKILLKQKYKQNTEQVKNFAAQISKQMPYDFHTVTKSLEELLHEKVLLMEGDMLIQKRMVKDNDISEKRALSGKLGGESTAQNISKTKKQFAEAKNLANTEIESKNTNEDLIGIGGLGENPKYQSIINSTIWLNSISIQKRITPARTLEYLDNFLKDLWLKDDFGKSEKEIKKHFISWLNIELSKPPKNENKVKGTLNAYEEARQKLGLKNDTAN